MSDFQINDGILARECDELAREIFDEIMEQNPGEEPESLRDDMDDRCLVAADGHEWVIYNHKALMLCAHCDTAHGEALLEDVGMPSDPDIYKIACLTAYGEMRGRIMEAIEELIEEWEPADA